MRAQQQTVQQEGRTAKYNGEQQEPQRQHLLLLLLLLGKPGKPADSHCPGSFGCVLG